MEVDEDDDFLKLNSSSSPFPPFWVVTDDCRAKFVRYKGCERGEGRGGCRNNCVAVTVKKSDWAFIVIDLGYLVKMEEGAWEGRHLSVMLLHRDNCAIHFPLSPAPVFRGGGEPPLLYSL